MLDILAVLLQAGITVAGPGGQTGGRTLLTDLLTLAWTAMDETGSQAQTR